MTELDTIRVFEPVLAEFETEEVKLWLQDMIKQIPDYIFDMPASTTGKHHNKTQCLPHGQIYHILMFCAIANYRLELKYNKEKYSDPMRRDGMRCVGILHDAIKCGWNAGKFTVHDHPILASEWVLNAEVEHNIDTELKEFIAGLCASHSGEWTTAKRGSKVVLPEPQTEEQMFCHECDYLASRNNIDMEIPEYLTEIFAAHDKEAINNFDLDNYVLGFGKYKGQRLIDVYNIKPDYVAWMAESIQRKDVQDAIAALMKRIEEDDDEL